MSHETSARTTAGDGGAAFRPAAAALWLFAVLLAAKTSYLLGQSTGRPEGFFEALCALATLTWRDLGFAAALGAVHAAAAGAVRGRPRAGRAVRRAFVALYLLAAGYGIANLAVFGFFLTPLTYPLLALVGDAAGIASSVAAFLSGPLLVGAVGACLAWTLLVVASSRLAAALTPRARRAAAVAALALTAGWTALGRADRVDWHQRLDRRLAENPHWTLVASTLRSAGETPVVLADAVSRKDLDDFLPLAERLVSARPDRAVRLASLAPRGRAGARVRNLVLVVLESVSARSLEVYGSRWPATPVLAAEAEHALVLDSFYAPAGRSSDSLAALLLSVHPPMTWRDVTSDHPELPGTSLAEVLEQRGYRTGFLTSSDLSWAGWRRFVGGRGFDSVAEARDLSCGPPVSSWGVEDRCLFDAALQWIGEGGERPFFLTAWTVQTHHPYEPSPGAALVDFFGDEQPRDAYDLGRYLNVLRGVDAELGRLFAHLRATGLDRSTLVVVVGDHGETFGEPHESYGHGTALYEENVRVPAILWSPVLFPRGVRSPIVTSHVDLNPTLADLLRVPPAGSWQGRSLFDAGRGSRAYFSVANDRYLLGVREDRWKYLLDATGGREELYDLQADPLETRNLAKLEPEVCRRLRQRLAARVEADRRLRASLPAAS